MIDSKEFVSTNYCDMRLRKIPYSKFSRRCPFAHTSHWAKPHKLSHMYWAHRLFLWTSWQYKITFFHALQQLSCVCDLNSVTFCKKLEKIWEWAEGCSQYFLEHTCSLIASEVSLAEKTVKNHSKAPLLVESINVQLSKQQYQYPVSCPLL